MQTPEDRPKGGGVGNSHDLDIIIRHPDDGNDGPEGFLHHQFRVMRHVVHDDGRQQRALAAGIVEDLRALFRRHVDALLEKLGRLRADHAAKLGRRVHRIAEPDLLRLLQHQRHEAVGNAFLHEDALDRRAALAGIAGRASDGDRRRLVQIGVVEIVEHDQRIVAAKLQRLTLVDRLRRDHLADRHAAGEGDDVDVLDW